MALFFTSDTHFNHRAVIDFCHRPFACVEEMNEAIIDRWNATVAEWDEVYHLGDFCWQEREAERFFSRLNGVKHLIAGNHDHKRIRKLPWASVQYAARLRVQRTLIYLSHYPVVGFREDFHFHGHQHNPSPSRLPRQVDVGVDAWSYRPVSLDEAMRASKADKVAA